MNIDELDAVTLLERAIFEHIMAIEDEFDRADIIERLSDKSKLMGIKTKFDEKLKAMIRLKKHETALERKQQAQTQNQSFSNFTQFDCEYPQLYCGNWVADSEGVRTFSMFGDSIACYHPILPVKRLVNIETNQEKMVIAFNKDGQWKEQVYEKATILSSTKIVSAMANSGILISSESSKFLVKYLLEVEAFNIHQIITERSTSRMGWLDKGEVFMPYIKKDVVFDSESSFQGLFKSMTAKGNKAQYLTLLKRIRQYKRKEPMMCVAASLASVLVKPCGALPFIFHLFGEAGKGKTISLMLASSIWGSPDENGYMADPKSTKTAFEMRLNFLNNLPFICDDMAQLKKFVTSQKNGDFADFIYLVCSGKGNERSNIHLGLQNQTTWRNSSITSSEKPITSEISNGGELLRVVELQTEAGNIFEKSKETADFLRGNYGFIGVEFIRTVQDLGDKVKDIYNGYIDRIRKKDPLNEKEGKQINSVALMLTADFILTEYIIKDNIFLDFDLCFNLIKSNKQMSDNERAYEFILNEISLYKKRFEEGEFEPDQRWGYFKDDNVLINPNVFSGMAERGNFNKKMFVEWACEKALAETNKGRIDKRYFGDIKGNYITIKIDEGQISLDDIATPCNEDLPNEF